MGIYTQLPDGLNEVDVIIAGGGTAACVVASRLTEADPSLIILVVEGGQDNKHNPTVYHPMLFVAALDPASTTTLFYKAKAESQLANRELIVPSGGVLGGGSSINMMMYSRAQRHDWDSWEVPEWSTDEMIPFLKKLETYHGPGSETVHGNNGPINISSGTYGSTRAQDQFIAAAQEVEYPELNDLQDLDSNNGVQRALRFIGKDGRRQDAATAYLHPRLEDGTHPNLHVLVENKVLRIIFEGKRAIGIEYKANSAFQNDTTVRTIKARKLVIGSCGALGTPLLLERSGLGDEAILSKANISTVAHIPGVGRNYQDHHVMLYSYYSALDPVETFDSIVSNPSKVPTLIQTNAPILGWNGQEVACKLRPNEADVRALGPEFEVMFEKEYKSVPNKPLALMALLTGFPGDPTTYPGGQFLAMSTFSVYPDARGHIHVSDANPNSSPDFETGFMKSALDIKKLIWAYKKSREIMRRMETYRGEFAGSHPPFSKDSAAALIKLDGRPNNTDVKDIVYTAEDDAVIEQWIRQNVGTTWHSLGTCKMGALKDGGVVAANLDVHGIEGLKLVDLSIVPQNVGANTANTAFAIGERAASIIIGELGLGSGRQAKLSEHVSE